MFNSSMSTESRSTGASCAAWTVELDSKNLESFGELFHIDVCLQRPEEQSLKKCPKVSSAPTLCYFFVSSELSPLYQRAALVFLFCLSARYEPDALALFLALSLLRCLAMSCDVRAVVRFPALLLSALSLQLLCASCVVHCFRAVALLLCCSVALVHLCSFCSALFERCCLSVAAMFFPAFVLVLCLA